jgi:hypothetical protein
MADWQRLISVSSVLLISAIMMWLVQWRYADGEVKKGKIQNIRTTVQIPECAKCQIEAAIIFLS